MENRTIPNSQLLLGKTRHNSYGVVNTHVPPAVTHCFERLNLQAPHAGLNFSANVPRKLAPFNLLIYDISKALSSIMEQERQNLPETIKAMRIAKTLLERVPASPHTLDQIMSGLIMSKGQFASAAEKIIENFPEIMIATAHIPYPGADGNRAFGIFFSKNPKTELENFFAELITRDQRGIDYELYAALSQGIDNGLQHQFFCKRIFESSQPKTSDGQIIKVGDMAISDYIESSQRELGKFIEVIRTNKGIDPLIVPLLRDARSMWISEYESIEILMNRAALLPPDGLERLHHTRNADIGSIKGLKIRPYDHIVEQEPFKSLQVLPPFAVRTGEVKHLLENFPQCFNFFLEEKDLTVEEALKQPFLTFKNNILESIRNMPEPERAIFESLFEKSKGIEPPRPSIWSSLKSHTEMHKHFDRLGVYYAMAFREFLPPIESVPYIRELLRRSGIVEAAKTSHGSEGRPIIFVDAGFKGTMPVLAMKILRPMLTEEGLNPELHAFLDYKIKGLPIPSHTEGFSGTSPLDGLSYLQNFIIPEISTDGTLQYKQDLFLTIHDAFLNHQSLSQSRVR